MEETLTHFELRVTEDRMAVLFDGELPAEGITGLILEIEERLEKMGIEPLPERKKLVARLEEAAAEDPRIESLILVEGKPLTPAEDARVEWTADFFNPGFLINRKTGAVDFRRRAAQVSVTEGQLLGRTYPVRFGEDGVDVFGERQIAANPKEVKIRAGSNVRWDPEKRTFHAASDGRIRLIGDTLSVDPVHVVEGCVDLKSGNIYHNGAVVVKEDVLEGAVIEAKGDVEVMGMVEGAEIQTSGNLTVHGGISQVEDLHFSVAGGVQARFILESKFRAGGDIVVEREIVNSNIKTLGRILVPGGRIVGGEVSAMRGILIGQAGTRASVPTVLIAGEDYSLPGKILNIRKDIKALEKQKQEFVRSIELLESCRSGLLPDALAKLQKTRARIAKLDIEIKKLLTEIQRITNVSRQNSRLVISVQRRLYPDSILCIGRDRHIVKDEVNGPLEARLDDGSIVLD